MACALCGSSRASITFVFSPVVDRSVRPSMPFVKAHIGDVRSGVKVSTVRRRAPSTWRPGAKIKAVWYPRGHGFPEVFGTIVVASVRTVLVRDFADEHVTTSQSLHEYMRQWVVKGCEPCTCGRWASLFEASTTAAAATTTTATAAAAATTATTQQQQQKQQQQRQ